MTPYIANPPARFSIESIKMTLLDCDSVDEDTGWKEEKVIELSFKDNGGGFFVELKPMNGMNEAVEIALDADQLVQLGHFCRSVCNAVDRCNNKAETDAWDFPGNEEGK